MTEEGIEKVAEILAAGGSLVMNRNDARRLQEATRSGNRPSIFDGVKIVVDKSGLVAEGQVVAAGLSTLSHNLNFRSCFDTEPVRSRA